jgi:hypothetical protein
MTIRTTGRVEDWRLIEVREGLCILAGRAYARINIPDGNWFTSSLVLRMTDRFAYTASGTEYALGEPYPADKDLPEEVGTILMAKGLTGRSFASIEHMSVEGVKLAGLCSPVHGASPATLELLRRPAD